MWIQLGFWTQPTLLHGSGWPQGLIYNFKWTINIEIERLRQLYIVIKYFSRVKFIFYGKIQLKNPLKKVTSNFSATLHLKIKILSSTPFWKFDWRFNPSHPDPPPLKKVGGCILCHVFLSNDLEYVMKRFLFSILFRLFSFLVEMCSRNTKWYYAFTRSQSLNPKFHCKIWLSSEILWFLVWFINDAIIKFPTRKFVVCI